VGRIRSGLSELFDLPDDYEVALGNGGTSLFWDIASLCLIERRSQHLSFGEFSSRFAAVAASAPHLETPEIIQAPPGERPDPVSSDVDAYALTQNETSTGVMAPVLRPDPGGLVMVDATSAAGAMQVDPRQFDAYYFAPQKAFGSEGGLWVALLSPAAIDRATTLATTRWCPPMLDLPIAVEESRRNQTLNTPALSTLFLLADQIDWILGQGGLAWSTRRCASSAGIVYRWAEASDHADPFVVDPDHRSTTIATIDMVGVDAGAVADVLEHNGIVDLRGYRKLGRNQLRIATFPAIETEDVERLVAAIDWIVERL